MNNDNKRTEALKWWEGLRMSKKIMLGKKYPGKDAEHIWEHEIMRPAIISSGGEVWDAQQPADNLHKEGDGHTPGEWISVKDELPTDFNDRGLTAPKLVYIDNPFFANGNYHVCFFQKNSFGEQYNNWVGIEPTVHHGDAQPNVTHWMELPLKP